MLFIKRKKRKTADEDSTPLVNGWTVLGRRISEKLQRCTEKVSPSRLRAWCVGMVVLGSVGSGWVLVASLIHPSTEMGIHSIRHPVVLPGAASDNLRFNPATTTSMAEVESYLRQLDSLSRDSVGRRWRDSLVRARPGLFDTIRWLEYWYGRKPVGRK